MFRIDVSLTILFVTPDRYFFSGIRNLFVLRAYPTMRVFVKYVVCIFVVFLEVVGPNS